VCSRHLCKVGDGVGVGVGVMVGVGVGAGGGGVGGRYGTLRKGMRGPFNRSTI
jgi:hypothetical protein